MDIILSIVVVLAITGLSAAIALAFLEIRHLQNEIQDLKSVSIPATASDLKIMNHAILELQELFRNRTEEGRGLPGNIIIYSYRKAGM